MQTNSISKTIPLIYLLSLNYSAHLRGYFSKICSFYNFKCCKISFFFFFVKEISLTDWVSMDQRNNYLEILITFDDKRRHP